MAISRYVISRTSLVGGQCAEGVFGVASRGWIKLVRIPAAGWIKLVRIPARRWIILARISPAQVAHAGE
ncbi:MAG: hypothetical protein QGD93_11550, partial [Actinomycetota bacterium]|nr:hypothetical protein [Actinomycetota bacterium]